MNGMHLRVYSDKSELVHSNGKAEIFPEGKTSDKARRRYRRIERALREGFLKEQIELCKSRVEAEQEFSELHARDAGPIAGLVDSITSERGRGVVVLAILQLCVKTIEPNQSIRLHKGSNSNSHFSWREGISMRSLDKKFITPTLREYGLLSLNSDGFMMTRTLAENYPYSRFYKAAIRGAKEEWVELVERIEGGQIEAEIALRYFITLLLNKAQEFVELADKTMSRAERFLSTASSNEIYEVILNHIDTSDYAARLMEISLHSFVQAIFELGMLEDEELVPLSQMRSANKKHGNIGDIEIVRDGQIIESWDSKYGKGYLRDEVDELAEKLPLHSEVVVAGFVTNVKPDRREELQSRISEIEDGLGVWVEVLTVEQWIEMWFSRVEETRVVSQERVFQVWLRFYCESLAQKRRHIAPIDEPCFSWVKELASILRSRI